MLNKKIFALSFILITTIIPLNLLARDNTPPPKGFDALVSIARRILYRNHNVLNQEKFGENAVDIVYESTNFKKNEIECQITFLFENYKAYYRYIYIGYNKEYDLFYVDVVPLNPSTSYASLVFDYLTTKRRRLWENMEKDWACRFYLIDWSEKSLSNFKIGNVIVPSYFWYKNNAYYYWKKRYSN